MSFLSNETIRNRLHELIPVGAKPDQIKHSAYELCLGEEAFTTDLTLPKPLKENDTVSIGAGQFALLLTQEQVYIPPDIIAFLSVKFSKKSRGLLNVSGFHVDPGYQGRLVFSVFNAGSHELILRKGEPLFLIWFAHLDKASTMPYGKGYIQPTLPTAAVNEIKPTRSGQRPISLASLDGELRVLRTRVDTLIAISIALIGLVGVAVLHYFFGAPSATPPS